MEFFKANINLGEVFVQLLAFVIIFWVLRTFAWKQISKSLAARREYIQNELDKIEAAKKEIESLRTEYTNHLQKIDQEARDKLQQAVSEGKRVSQEIQEESRKAARQILEKAKEDIRLEMAKARVTLRNEIANTVLSATEHLIEKKMDNALNKEIVLDFIDQLDKVK